MKKKTIRNLIPALALVLTTIGTATVAFAAAPEQPETPPPAEEEGIWKQVRILGEKSDEIYLRTRELWDKVNDACNALPEDFDFDSCDEATFIQGLTTLTEQEKAVLSIDVKELERIDDQLEALYEKLPDEEELPLCWQMSDCAGDGCSAEDMQEQEYDCICLF